MKRNTIKLFVTAATSIAAWSTTANAAVWDAFVIRNNASPTTPLTIVGTSDGSSVITNIDESGEKTGYGTSFFDGQNVGSVKQVNYTRVDPGTKDPYINIWITDTLGHSAVIAPVANMTSSGGYTSNDVNGLDLQTLGFNIYETDTSDLTWLGITGAHRVNQAVIDGSNNVVTLADIASLTVADPGSPYSGFVGSGAPKNGTGFNIIFGDTQGNFVSPVPYELANVSVVPEPTSIALVVIGGAALLLRRRRRTA